MSNNKRAQQKRSQKKKIKTDDRRLYEDSLMNIRAIGGRDATVYEHIDWIV